MGMVGELVSSALATPAAAVAGHLRSEIRKLVKKMGLI